MRSVAAGVVLVVAAVSGCSAGDGAPAEVSPLASGTALPSARSSPALTVEGPDQVATAAPSEAKPATFPVTAQGASDFARAYVTLIGQGFATADSAALRLRTAPGCEGCEALIGAIDQAAAEGLRQRGGEYRVSSVAAPPVIDGDVVLLLTYSRTASEIVDLSGQVVDRAPAVPMTTVQMRLIHNAAGWRTQGYRLA